MSSATIDTGTTSAALGTSETTPVAESKSARTSAAHTTYRRRQRAAQACETCHARKVRCDVSMLGVPCTNCAAFRVECQVPQRNALFAANVNSSSIAGPRRLESVIAPKVPAQTSTQAPTTLYHMSEQGPMPALTEEQAQDQTIAATMLRDLMNKTEFTVPDLGETDQVTFLGESASVNWIIRDHNHPLHYPMAARFGQLGAAGPRRLDSLEMDILDQRGAFRLPPKPIRDELVAAFFKWVHPLVPAINKTQFMRDYEDPSKSTSLFLLQTIMLAGSRVCRHPRVSGNVDSQKQLSQTFYDRAKALYDAGYETDRIKMIQGLILMSWFCGTPTAVTDNSFFWISVAISVAEGAGMHRSIERSNLSRSQKRTWKRIWWTLYTRDREIAITLGRPCIIKLEDSDVEPATADDLIDDEADTVDINRSAPSTEAQFFLDFVRLCDIITVILSEQYSVNRHRPRNAALDLIQSDMALGEWMQDCQLRWSESDHNFWSAMLSLYYHTAVCLLHRPYLPSGEATGSTRNSAAGSRLSRNMAYHSADAITLIVEVLTAKDELLYCPSFVQYSLLCAVTLHRRREHDPDPANVNDVGRQIETSNITLQKILKTAPMSDTVRTWVEPAPRPTHILTSTSKNHIKEKRRSQSFLSHPSMGPPGQSIKSLNASNPSSRRLSNTQKSSVQPDFAPLDSAPRTLTAVDNASAVPGVPADMLSVFGLTPVSPEQVALPERKEPHGRQTTEIAAALPPPAFQYSGSYQQAAEPMDVEDGSSEQYLPLSPMTWDNQQIYESTLDGGNVLRPGGFEGHRHNTVGFMGTTSGLPGAFTDIAMDDWFRYFGVHEEQE
ncbi:fungal-specific transcription factor domain-containing protein [Microdochium trichocladiopsis]|uniref:Fungal-specific transcription factor domain-containing protein n=1 Tax=Microdochium trichocladiopsis TaxID=1682393 RepID=A0A9P8YDV5_9PEZI|nr:fungal-specific transcription factor domain-containing protein [Microdochium trichocladiopsis]KAH7037191.1 fungal-specific transcription factor domain-containing protein [Microdochium trichocladiopsis]